MSNDNVHPLFRTILDAHFPAPGHPSSVPGITSQGAPPVLGAWRYESDGDVGSRTHYAVRDDASEPCGIARLDFPTAKMARAWIARSNALIVRLMNERKP
jgi:hypothetical protein